MCAGPRTTVLLVPFIVSAVWSTAEFAPAQQPEGQSTPNVVMIISDDQAWTDYGFMGHPHIATPALDRLAEQSLTYTRGYVPSSLCRPSLATMITGLYPHQHGITGNDPAFQMPKGARRYRDRWLTVRAEKDQPLRGNIETHATLPRLLKARSYVSLQTGKWWEGQPRLGGFDVGMTHGDPARGGRHGDAGLTIGREGLGPIVEFVDAAVADGEPFFVWYAPFMPHAPHTPPERLLQKYLPVAPSEPVARYWAMCEWFDETCGELLKFLDDRKLADDTLVLYVCDNGWIQDVDRVNRYAPRSKRSPYEGGVRTPIMVRMPGQRQGPIDHTTPVSSVDLAPTILRACGLQPGDAMSGIDLRERKALADRNVVYGEIFDHDVADVDRPTSSLRYRWIIDGFWKLIVPNAANVDDAEVELYDLQNDPHERRNVALAEPGRVARLKHKLDLWWRP